MKVRASHFQTFTALTQVNGYDYYKPTLTIRLKQHLDSVPRAVNVERGIVPRIAGCYLCLARPPQGVILTNSREVSAKHF